MMRILALRKSLRRMVKKNEVVWLIFKLNLDSLLDLHSVVLGSALLGKTLIGQDWGLVS
ncbi:MAG: hypothetical protein ACJAYF_000848 [Arenicella sp.]|jgi:hypothetical protein